jgi:anti-sigma factor RsiW
MLDCREVLDNLSCYLDGEGGAGLRRALEEHIAQCRRCRVMLDTTRRTLRIVVDAEPFEVPLAVSARLYARVAKMLAEP